MSLEIQLWIDISGNDYPVIFWVLLLSQLSVFLNESLPFSLQFLIFFPRISWWTYELADLFLIGKVLEFHLSLSLFSFLFKKFPKLRISKQNFGIAIGYRREMDVETLKVICLFVWFKKNFKIILEEICFKQIVQKWSLWKCWCISEGVNRKLSGRHSSHHSVLAREIPPILTLPSEQPFSFWASAIFSWVVDCSY